MKKWISSPLTTALGAVVLVALCLLHGLIYGMTLWSLFGLVLLFLLLAGATIGLLVRGVAQVIQSRSFPGRHFAALLIVVGVFAAVWFGRIPNRVLVLRTQLMVARTGGQAALQAWAVETLARPRDSSKGDAPFGEVPRAYWSEQVVRLHPHDVRIAPVFKGDVPGVCLRYPWLPHEAFMEIRIGPPGAVPLEHEDRPAAWLRCADGLYNWFQCN